MNIEPIETEAATETRAAFTVEARALSNAVKLLSGKVTERRNTIPILSALLIDVAPCGLVTVTATDLDMQASIDLRADSGETIEPGQVCVDAKGLADALAKACKDSDRVRVTVERPEPSAFDGSANGKPLPYRVNVKAGRGNWKLKGAAPDAFPLMPVTVADCSGELNAAQFLGDLKALAPAVSTEETRFYLNGYAAQVCELGGRDRFALVATNGWAAAAASRPIPAGLESWQDAIIPRKFGAVMLAAAKLAGDAQTLTLSRFGGKIAATLGAVSIVSKLIDGTFPYWQQAFERIAAPTADSNGPMFPDMMPGRPTGAMETLAKAAPVAIDWAQGDGGFTGEAPDDAGLAYIVTQTAAKGEPVKGYRYEYSGHNAAESYLKALAEAAGLPSPAEMKARADAVTDEFTAARPGYASFHGEGALQFVGARIVGFTVQGEVRRRAWRETVRDWEALCDRTIEHPETLEALEGSYSVVMPAHGPQLTPEHSVTVEGDCEYPIAVNSGGKIHLSKEQVAALCGDDLWNVLEFPGADGKPRYVSQWLWDDGATRLLCVGADGRCPKAGAPREYVTRAEVEAALAGDVVAVIEAPAPIPAEPIAVASEAVSLPETAPVCVAATPPATHAAETVESEPLSGPVEPEPVSAPDACPIAAVRTRLAEIEALLATLSAETERPKRTAAHERAIKRAWSERKAARAMRFNLELARDMAANNKRMAEFQRDRAQAAQGERDKAMAAYNRGGDQRRSLQKERDDWQGKAARAADRAKLSDAIAEDHLRMREDVQRALVATEARLAAAEAENAQLWAEIEGLTAPVQALAA